MLGELLEIMPRIWQFANRVMDVDNMCNELRNVQVELNFTVNDMERIATAEVHNTMSRKRKGVVTAFFAQVHDYNIVAQQTLNDYMAEQQHGWPLFRHVRYVLAIERYLSEGNGYLRKGAALREEGLTYEEVVTRGEKLPAGELMGETVHRHFHLAQQALNREDVSCIGIYGSVGAGKSNLMKHLHNLVYDDVVRFKAVFWATAPREHTNMALQKCVADAMKIDLNDDDVVRRAGLLARRLDDFGEGRKILFLDNVRQYFSAHEVIGFPCAKLNCILVLTTPSKEVCNRMHCDPILEMNLLPKTEAEELFLSAAGWPRVSVSNQKQVRDVAMNVANQCARMPLAIILIARSMEGLDDIQEWRNRLNWLLGKVEVIDDVERKILEQLTFGYTSMNLSVTEDKCFKAAASLLIEDRQCPTEYIIEQWRSQEIIGVDRTLELAYDQGQTILNRLQRRCLVEIEEPNKSVTMNKWIRNMAATL